MDESVPDHLAIWCLRQALATHRLAEALFEEINCRLDVRGLIVRQGTLIEASVKPPSEQEGVVGERHPEAGWTKKNHKNHFGYKAHLAVDDGSEIIRTAILTSADLHDCQPVAHLIRGAEHAVYGDKAPASQDLRDRVADAGIKERPTYKAVRNKPLKPWQGWFNTAVAAIRAAVERRTGS